MNSKGLETGRGGHNFIDITGERFGRLIVIKDGLKGNKNNSICECKCSCGIIKFIRKGSLKNGNTKSCGCLQRELASKNNTAHNLSKHPLYDVWKLMLRRCHDRNNKNFSIYGGNKIYVCIRWMFSLKNFIKDMGSKPTPKYTLDRIDNKKGYNIKNCKWSTQKEQCRNKRNNHLLTFNRATKCISEWADDVGFSSKLIYDRINKLGWSVEKALTTVARKRRLYE